MTRVLVGLGWIFACVLIAAGVTGVWWLAGGVREWHRYGKSSNK